MKPESKVLQLCRDGLSVPEIAQKAGLHQGKVRRILRRHGMSTKQRVGRLPDDTEDILREIAEIGAVEGVATKYGVTTAAVYWRLKRYRLRKAKEGE